MREFERKRQPHLQARDTAYSVTFLLHDAVTGPQLESLRRELDEILRDIDADPLDRKAFRKAEARTRATRQLESLLASQRDQAHALADPAAARVVAEYFQKFDGELLRLFAYSVMSNHAHVLFDLSPQLDDVVDSGTIEWPIDRLVGRLKGGSAFAANKALRRNGSLWMKGYYDRYIRSGRHFDAEYWYILMNPVKAGLVVDYGDHAATWGRPGVTGRFRS